MKELVWRYSDDSFLPQYEYQYLQVGHGILVVVHEQENSDGDFLDTSLNPIVIFHKVVFLGQVLFSKAIDLKTGLVDECLFNLIDFFQRLEIFSRLIISVLIALRKILLFPLMPIMQLWYMDLTFMDF